METKERILNILLVEDNQNDVVLIQEAFRENNLLHLMKVAGDGQEALDLLKSNGKPGAFKKPDIIMLDINMPVLNGFELLNQLRADPELCSIPVVMLTVSNRQEDVARAYRSGARSYLHKPASFDQFCSLLNKFGFYWRVVTLLPER
jgi:CheY-like chemotaxis protein